MTLIKWRHLNSINNDIDVMFDKIFNDGWNNNRKNIPSVDVIENDKEFILTTDLPGFDKKDINIEVEKNGMLKITTDSIINKKTNEEIYRIRERNNGSYYREFDLPENVIIDKINAQYKNGELIVNVPKAKEIKSEKTKIKIS